jgi:acyl carrier protein
MNSRRLDSAKLQSQLKHLVADLFRLDLLEPDLIGDDEPLMGGRLGLDEHELTELALCIEEQFGLKFCPLEESRHAFASTAALAGFIHAAGKPKLARPFQPTAQKIVHEVLISPVPA